jgi:hypothetical protein
LPLLLSDRSALGLYLSYYKAPRGSNVQGLFVRDFVKEGMKMVVMMEIIKGKIHKEDTVC